jgi:hypothetical protein
MSLQKIKKLQDQLQAPVLIRNSTDLFYLTGHNFSDGGFLFVSKKNAVLFGGFLEKVQGVKTDFLKNIQSYIGRSKTLLIDNKINLEELGYLQKCLPNTILIPTETPVKKMRLL